jgi:5-methylthioadenosine/S-adenosylhomocysteine deaminase
VTAEKSQISRGNYLIKSGAVITVDPALGTFPKADVLVRNGLIADVGPRAAR